MYGPPQQPYAWQGADQQQQQQQMQQYPPPPQSSSVYFANATLPSTGGPSENTTAPASNGYIDPNRNWNLTSDTALVNGTTTTTTAAFPASAAPYSPVPPSESLPFEPGVDVPPTAPFYFADGAYTAQVSSAGPSIETEGGRTGLDTNTKNGNDRGSVSFYSGNYNSGGGLPDGLVMSDASDSDLDDDGGNEEESHRSSAEIIAEEDEDVEDLRQRMLRHSSNCNHNDRFTSSSSAASSLASHAPWTHPSGTAHQRLHLHPLIPPANFNHAAADPITAALARQQQQLFRGEPRSPLSPRTLQALCTASATGDHRRFLAQLTPDDVLAAPPLALTWYPSVPAGVTKHPERKRVADMAEDAESLQSQGVWSARTRHELDRLAEESEDVPQRAASAAALSSFCGGLRQGKEEVVENEEGADVPRMPRRRARLEATAAASALNPFPPTVSSEGSTTNAAAAPSIPPQNAFMNSAGTADTTRTTSGEVGGTPGQAEEEPAKEVAMLADHTEAHRKRERSEPVFEYSSHGRRLN